LATILASSLAVISCMAFRSSVVCSISVVWRSNTQFSLQFNKSISPIHPTSDTSCHVY
jgi:hypothetical protein